MLDILCYFWYNKVTRCSQRAPPSRKVVPMTLQVTDYGNNEKDSGKPEVVYVPRSLIGLLADHHWRVRDNRAYARTAKKNADLIVKKAKQAMRASVTAELPASRMARVNHHVGQVSELVTTVSTIVTATTAIAAAGKGLYDLYLDIRTQPKPTS